MDAKEEKEKHQETHQNAQMQLDYFKIVNVALLVCLFFGRCKVFASMASNLNIYFAPLGKAQKKYSPINITISKRSNWKKCKATSFNAK